MEEPPGAAGERGPAPAPAGGGPPPGRGTVAAGWVLGAATVVALACGAALRGWLLTHLPLNADEAVVALMARGIDAGHLTTFYWGQHYGGVEPYAVAAVFGVAGPSPMALEGTAAGLSLVAAGLAAAAVWEIGRRWWAALAAGAVVWVWPYAAVWNSVHELGFRLAALCCGLLFAWCAARLVRRPGSPWVAAALGLSLGVGWWASPEIAYFALPAAVTAGGALVLRWRAAGGGLGLDAGARGGLRRAAALVAAGALVGSLPWLSTNLRDGFLSLRPSAADVSGGGGYASRLGVFFTHVLPVQVGAQRLYDGAWVGGTAVGVTILVVALAVIAAGLVGALVPAAWRGRGAAGAVGVAAALAVVAFPLLFAAVPDSSYWADGRYGVYFGPLVVLLVGAAAARWLPARAERRAGGPRRRAWVPALAAAVAVVATTAVTVAGAHDASAVPYGPGHFTQGWGDPNQAARQAVAAMEAHHLRTAYGDYWTAYVLDVLSGGRLEVSPSPLDVRRDPALSAAVAASPRPAWLFFAPGAAGLDAAWDFSNPQPGPGPYDEQSFEAALRAHGIAYRVVPLGVLDAVVPRAKVPFA